MERTINKKNFAAVKTNGASNLKSRFPISKADMHCMLSGAVCVIAALLIRYAIYLPQYMK